MKKNAPWLLGFLCSAALGGVTALVTTQSIPHAESATISPFDPEYDVAIQLMQPLLVNVETVTLPEAVVCNSEFAAIEIAAAFEAYGTPTRFSIAYEVYSTYWIPCRYSINFPIATDVIPFEPSTFAQLHQNKRAFVVEQAGGDYVVVARPEVFDAVFRTCRFRYTPMDVGVQTKDSDSCWRDL